ncbi:MAG: hypothetical protein HC854_16480 [Flavobacterium sp.]|nr:hypothetical protein [Flavobacterium sp.]
MKKLFLLLILSIGILSCEKNADDNIENQNQLLLKDMNPYKGTKETIVTIIGEGFNIDISLNKVTLNDKICPIISVDSNQIVFSIPENANSGNIVVNSGILTSELPYFTFLRTINEEEVVASNTVGINKPYGIVKDDLDNLYVLDNFNHQIKK